MNRSDCVYYIPGGDCEISNRVKIMCVGCPFYTRPDTLINKGIKGVVIMYGFAKKIFDKK